MESFPEHLNICKTSSPFNKLLLRYNSFYFATFPIILITHVFISTNTLDILKSITLVKKRVLGIQGCSQDFYAQTVDQVGMSEHLRHHTNMI